MSIIYNTNTVRRGLALHLDAENRKSYNSGLLWTDLSSTRNHATLVGAAAFNQTSPRFFNFPSGAKATFAPISAVTPVTATVWYRRSDVDGSSTWRSLLATASTNIHHLIVHSTTKSLGVFDGAFKDFSFVPQVDNLFHTYTVVYNNSTTASLYVDGTFISSLSTTLNLSTSPFGTLGNWASNNYWAGHIAGCIIHDGALSENEIKAVHDAYKGRYST